MEKVARAFGEKNTSFQSSLPKRTEEKIERQQKTISEYIIDALWYGEGLRSPEIAEKVSELSGKEMRIQDIASVLSKLSNSNLHEIGFLIRRRKHSKGYV